MRTLSCGFLAVFDPVSPTTDGNYTKPFILTVTNCHTHQCRASIARSEKVSTNEAPIEFAKNPQLPETATTSGAESQSGSIMEL